MSKSLKTDFGFSLSGIRSGYFLLLFDKTEKKVNERREREKKKGN